MILFTTDKYVNSQILLPPPKQFKFHFFDE